MEYMISKDPMSVSVLDLIEEILPRLQVMNYYVL